LSIFWEAPVAGGCAAYFSAPSCEQTIVARSQGNEVSSSFDISPFDKALVEAGGWVEYADARY
jgi:hypothetical protein